VAAAGPPEFLYFPVLFTEASSITRQVKEVNDLEKTILGTNGGIIFPDRIDAMGLAGEGLYISGRDLSFPGDDFDEFISFYEEKFNIEQPQTSYQAYAYDAANMLFDCIEKVAIESKGKLYIGRQALRVCLYETEKYPGITGILTCNEFGDCFDSKISISQLTQGQLKRIWP
jgi:branched-chain amino acid transport system substrate-binding protein